MITNCTLKSVLQSTQEMFDCLVKHGCTDFSASIDPARYSLSAIATGGFGDVWQAWLKDGILVAVKSLRLQMILDGDEKGMKVGVSLFQLWKLLSLFEPW